MSESETDEENNSDIIEFRDGTLMRKRKKQKVLRYNKFPENESKEEHYRQLLMLLTSWRNEEYDLLKECDSFYESYKKMEDIILQNQQKYEKNDQKVLDTAITDYSEEFENSIRDPVLPQVDHEELIDSSEEHNMEVLASVSEPQKTLVEAIDNISEMYKKK
ncbi:hypothetical protein MAR_006172 [Mya arenaria]|uniref:Uncharacterized protein n=1 Tax=Mya arenaria TaxID=6604 RepID=A0ABY7D9D0_MYAAR|nr:hypothetical protein MAR_006172 [Mya arenaria]